jgi:hypothetical protein
MLGCVVANAATPCPPRRETHRRPAGFLSVDAPHTHTTGLARPDTDMTMTARAAASIASVHSGVRRDLNGLKHRCRAIDEPRSSARPASINERDDTEQGARQRIKIPLANAGFACAVGGSFTIRRQRTNLCGCDRAIGMRLDRERHAMPTPTQAETMQARLARGLHREARDAGSAASHHSTILVGKGPARRTAGSIRPRPARRGRR